MNFFVRPELCNVGRDRLVVARKCWMTAKRNYVV